MGSNRIVSLLRTPLPDGAVRAIELTMGLSALSFLLMVSIVDPKSGIPMLSAALLLAFFSRERRKKPPRPPRPPAGKPVPPPRLPPAISGALEAPLPEEQERIAARSA